jgi:hypothetical protein
MAYKMMAMTLIATSAPAAEANPHVTDIKLLGWKPALVGTCADASGNQMNGMKKGDTTALMSQRACAIACDADAGCVGYQHGKGECIAFGATAGTGWTSVTGSATTITTSVAAATEYITVLPCGTHTTLTTTFDACTLGARYHEVGTSGGCRGNGGSNDRINSKEGQGFTRAECETACDTDTDCVGYAFVTSGSGSCILYGSGIAGSCGNPLAKTKAHCTGYGTCTPTGTVTIASDNAGRAAAASYGTPLAATTLATCRDSGDRTSAACVEAQLHGAWDVRDGQWLAAHSDWRHHQEYCGVCGIDDGRPLAQTKASCGGGYTWVDWTWTADAGVWTEPVENDPRFDTYESQTTTHIHTSSPTAGVQCYELDNKDHDNQCHGLDSHGSVTGTATREDSFCQATFEAAATSTAADCPVGCVYHAKPVMQGEKKTHPADILAGQRPGFNVGVSGACRSDQGRGPTSMRSPRSTGCNAACRLAQSAPYNEADPILGGSTPASCWAYCQKQGANCVAYHNGPAWCTLSVLDLSYFKTGANAGTSDGVDWTKFASWDSFHSDNSSAWPSATSSWSAGDPVVVTDITKPNVQYMCFWRLTASQWAAKATKVTAVLTVAGAVSDYDAAKQILVRKAIAKSASVHVDQVGLTVTAASVKLAIEIFVDDAATVTSLTTALKAEGGMLSSGTAFETAMTSGGVTMTVEAITVGSETTPPPSAPPSDDDGLGTGAIVGVVVGCLAFVLAAVGVAAFFMMKKGKKTAPGDKGVEA